MVRFKVIKGSHLLLVVAVVILAAALAFVILQGASSRNRTVQTVPTSEVVQRLSPVEAEAQSAFASNSSATSALSIEILTDTPQPASNSDGMRVLIYHTHTHEAYAQDSADPYEAVETWRTTDQDYSVVRVGSALADALTQLGYSVVHDRTDHEQDSIDDAYIRSLETLEGYAESFDLRIDLHRDAFVEGLQPCIEDDQGNTYAQLMLLVGRGDAYSGDELPPYEDNLAFAQRLTSALNARIPGICRNVTVKSGRYNQHVDKRCILVEVGHNQNTLQQALASVPCLAEAIDSVLKRESKSNTT